MAPASMTGHVFLAFRGISVTSKKEGGYVGSRAGVWRLREACVVVFGLAASQIPGCGRGITRDRNGAETLVRHTADRRR